MISYSIRCAHQFIRSEGWKSVFVCFHFSLYIFICHSCVDRNKCTYYLRHCYMNVKVYVSQKSIPSSSLSLSLSRHFIWLLFVPFFCTCFYFVIRLCFASEAVESNFVILQFLIDNIFQSFHLIPFTRCFKFIFFSSSLCLRCCRVLCGIIYMYFHHMEMRIAETEIIAWIFQANNTVRHSINGKYKHP